MAVAITLSWATFSTQGEFREIEIHRNPTAFTPDGTTLLAIVNGTVKTFTDDTVKDDSYYALVGVEQDNTRRPMDSFLVPLCGKPEPVTEDSDETQPIFDVEVNAYMVDSDDTARDYMNSTTGLTTEEIYRDWPRVTDRKWYDNAETADTYSYSSEYDPDGADTLEQWKDKQAWLYEGPNKGFVYQENYAAPVFIISRDPKEKVNDLFGSGTLTSNSEDNDGIGIVIAADNFVDDLGNDRFRFLALWVERNNRNDSGVPAGGQTFSIRYGDETNGAIQPDGDGGTTLTPYGGMGDIIVSNLAVQKGQWFTSSGGEKEVKYEFEKVGNVVKARVGNVDEPFVNPDSELTVDMTTDLPRDGASLANNPMRFGFAVSSQRFAYFKDINWKSPDLQNNNTIYSAYGNKKWVYTGEGTINGWALQGGARPDFNGVGTINNIETGESFSFDGSVFRPITATASGDDDTTT